MMDPDKPKRGRPPKTTQGIDKLEKNDKKTDRKPNGFFDTGNPGGPGRPKTIPELKAAFLAATPEQVEYLQKLKDDPKARVADRIRAAEIIIDHGIGRAPQEVTVTPNSKLTVILDSALAKELTREDETNR